MKLHIINPNTSQAMSDKILQVAQQARRTADVEVLTSTQGPASLESHVDDALAIPGLLLHAQALEAHKATDGILIACFGDPGIDAVRELSSVPVLGIAESAMHTAAMLGERFSVVTTLARTLPTAQRIVQRIGLTQQCTCLRACNVPVQSLEHANAECRALLLQECQRAAKEDDIDAIVLGCAGMADLAAELSDAVGLPVVDGVSAGIQLLEGLVHQGLRPAKHRDHAYPAAKAALGPYASLLSTSLSTGAAVHDTY